MVNLAIMGHKTRGKEVIEILEMLGGTNRENYWGVFENRLYLINTFGDIEDRSLSDNSNYQIYTLEEFLEKFPYKVGDKVYNIIHNENQTITDLAWDFQENEVVYQTNNNEYLFVNYLQPYKEETMEKEKKDYEEWFQIDYLEFENNDDMVGWQCQYMQQPSQLHFFCQMNTF